MELIIERNQFGEVILDRGLVERIISSFILDNICLGEDTAMDCFPSVNERFGDFCKVLLSRMTVNGSSVLDKEFTPVVVRSKSTVVLIPACETALSYFQNGYFPLTQSGEPVVEVESGSEVKGDLGAVAHGVIDISGARIDNFAAMAFGITRPRIFHPDYEERFHGSWLVSGRSLT